MALNWKIALSLAQRSVINMLRTRGGSVRMVVNEKALGEAGKKGLEGMKMLGVITMTPLVGGAEEMDVRLTPAGIAIATEILESLKGA